jgi:prepilin-type N-terminal cleavage/methylation domain-containing protein
MRYKRNGFTIVELLTVLAIIALLAGLLIPALNMARNAARVAKQKVQFVSIDQAIYAFRNDYGDYPPSNLDTTAGSYCGAQKLAEALLGLDLMGFHPSSAWRADGKNATGTPVYDLTNTDNLAQRKSRYLELENVGAFKIREVFVSGYSSLAPDTYVLCDVFGKTLVTIGTKSVNAGMPILYYKANSSGIGLIANLRREAEVTYRYTDNADIVTTQQSEQYIGDIDRFVNFITNPKVPNAGGYPQPYRPDSYILISAGIDGIYGTTDDITNFGN